MKTKLLRKIIKQYSIVYYPNRKVYEVLYDTKNTLNDIHGLFENELYQHFDTLQQAKDALLKEFCFKYRKHSKQYKLNKIKEKVWYNS